MHDNRRGTETKGTCQAPMGHLGRHPILLKDRHLRRYSVRLAFCPLRGYSMPFDLAWIAPETSERAPWQKTSTFSTPPSHCSSGPPCWRLASGDGCVSDTFNAWPLYGPGNKPLREGHLEDLGRLTCSLARAGRCSAEPHPRPQFHRSSRSAVSRRSN